MKKKIKFLLKYSMYFWSFIYTSSFSLKLEDAKNILYTLWISRFFRVIGARAKVKYSIRLIGGKYISIGDNTVIGKRIVLTAWNNVGLKNNPKIIIGNNCNIGDGSHITAINEIVIGNNVLTGKKITITDNAHGQSILEHLLIPPNERPLFSKGAVVIHNNVWIGEKATILPGVVIGENSIIGANSVVTKEVPKNSVVAGIPAKIIKIIK